MVWADGRRIQGKWSREGGGVVGPLPRINPMRMTMVASSGQTKPQRLKVVPPWGEAGAVWLEVSTAVAEHAVEFAAPAGAGTERTGVYRFYVAEPYDPARDGQAGYAPDLGVLMHRVRIAEAE